MTPANKFMAELLQLANSTSLFGINPDDNEEYIIDDAVALEMHTIPDNPNYIHFISIRALHPDKGHGSKVMKRVFDIVDKNNITLIGKILPYHTKNLNKNDLRAWYRRNGCRPLNSKNEDGLWVRAPGGGWADVDLSLVTHFKILNGFSEEDYLGRKVLFGLLLVIGLIILYTKYN